MNDENWKEELKQLNPSLKPYQIKLLEEGAGSNSQTLMLCDMWLEWKDLSAKKKLKEIANEKLGDLGIENPWHENCSETPKPCNHVQLDIDDKLLKKVKPLTRSVLKEIDKGAIAKQRLSSKADDQTTVSISNQ
ncbi:MULTISPECIES: hypothetical protein [unclassified Prochlorococcus]|uniref:hypothetical protein n=1 Tax=unclassified Prochlorococcus TaxID=2627481 RepID=UPI00053378D8|nr:MULTISPECIES: hypothetical protein [unclassified Prochlorococcus]KGG16098.1 putative protein family PM-7 [Prochlorococcus sp. MIT 0602]KGG17217.1 putative protein family PM-7 [Prochlorococcus sp. MIT 0603]